MKRAVSLFLVFAFALLIFSTTAFVEPIFAYNFDGNGTQPYDDSTQSSYYDSYDSVQPYDDQSYDDNAQPYELSNNNFNDEADGISDNVLRATFSTTYSNSSPNRKHNIKLAASKLNITLYPDEIFSFNRIVGERSEARGFLTAHIILDGKFVDGVGGGVCQVSTTLYNCALLSDLEILCAHRHSLPVSYVAPSFDAMVSTRSDLVFTNSTASPIKIKATADDTKISISIYGDIMTRKVVARSVVIKTLPFETEEVKDSNIPLGKILTLARGKNGIKSNAYIDIYEDSKYIATRLLRRDSYNSQKQIVAIGTKPLEPEINLAEDELP